MKFFYYNYEDGYLYEAKVCANYKLGALRGHKKIKMQWTEEDALQGFPIYGHPFKTYKDAVLWLLKNKSALEA